MILSIAIHPEDLALFSLDDREFMIESLGRGKLVEDQSIPRGQMMVSRITPKRPLMSSRGKKTQKVRDGRERFQG